MFEFDEKLALQKLRKEKCDDVAEDMLNQLKKLNESILYPCVRAWLEDKEIPFKSEQLGLSLYDIMNFKYRKYSYIEAILIMNLHLEMAKQMPLDSPFSDWGLK